jgi:hypothetical protein
VENTVNVISRIIKEIGNEGRKFRGQGAFSSSVR